MPANLRLALGAAAGAGNTPQAMPATLQTYELLPDREEFVAPQPLRATLLALTPALVLAAPPDADGVLVVGKFADAAPSLFSRPERAPEHQHALTEALAALDVPR
jgi:hypothetical protein